MKAGASAGGFLALLDEEGNKLKVLVFFLGVSTVGSFLFLIFKAGFSRCCCWVGRYLCGGFELGASVNIWTENLCEILDHYVLGVFGKFQAGILGKLAYEERGGNVGIATENLYD